MKVSIFFFFAVLAVATGSNALLTLVPTVLTKLQQELKSKALVGELNTFLTNALQIGADGVSLVSPLDRTVINTTTLNLPGNQTLDIGALTLPLNLLCQQQGLLKALICHICSQDCTYVHNKYGGVCGIVDPTTAMEGTPQTTGPVCICNDRPDGSNLTDATASCGPIIDSVIDPAIILSMKLTLRSRMHAAQCTPVDVTNPVLFANSAGCHSDCTTNHNYKNGTCAFNEVVSSSYQGETLPGNNCNCYYDNLRSLYPPTA